jgi:5,10-methylenetetrahydromethanopterin reductase
VAGARPLTFGIRLSQFVGCAKELIELAVRAEENQFDQVWFPSDPFLPNAWALSSAVAMRTNRIRVGSLGTNPYLTSPAEIATFVATLDHLTDGRALLGIGLHSDAMLHWLGYDTSDFVERVRETVIVVRALLAGETPSQELALYPWSDEWRLRFPRFRDSPPIYLTPFAPRHHELAGEIADGSLPMLFPPNLAATIVEMTRRGVTRSGRTVETIDIAGCLWLSLGTDRAEALDLIRPLIVHYGAYMSDESLDAVGVARAEFDGIEEQKAAGRTEAAEELVTEKMLDFGVAGDAATVIERIEAIAAAGITQINVGGPLGPDPAAAISLMGSAVIPRFR